MPQSKQMEYTTGQIKSFKWPVTASRKIEAPTKDIWAAISSPGNLEDCHPFCEKNPVDQWPGIGSRDTIHYYSGWVLHREFTGWIDGEGYDLIIGREGGRKSFVSWRIIADRENSSRLDITLYPHILQNIPAIVRWMPHLAYIRPMMQSYLESVVNGFAWFITSGKPVKKNQFGSHRWFSTASN
ncbi:MAG: hypothetical protein ABFS17_11445 [Chloroflexota bacterium]